EMAGYKLQIWAQLARPSSRHPSMNTKDLGFVGSCKHNPTPDGNRLAAQRRVEQLFDRGVKSVEVRMQNRRRACVHVARPTPCIDGKRTPEHKENNEMNVKPPVASVILSGSTTRCDCERDGGHSGRLPIWGCGARRRQRL